MVLLVSGVVVPSSLGTTGESTDSTSTSVFFIAAALISSGSGMLTMGVSMISRCTVLSQLEKEYNRLIFDDWKRVGSAWIPSLSLEWYEFSSCGTFRRPPLVLVVVFSAVPYRRPLLFRSSISCILRYLQASSASCSISMAVPYRRSLLFVVVSFVCCGTLRRPPRILVFLY